MVYESQISFTLDTICPWTYLAKKRLDEALRRVNENPENTAKVHFTIKYLPYQLYPEASQAGEDKYEWYKKSRYGDSEDKMEMYMKLMTSYGATAGISYKFHGTVANTLQAHRVIYNIQEAHGSNKTNLLISSLYKQYFENEQHPSNKETLMKACADAGVDEKEAKTLVDDEYEGLMDVKNLIREQISNGVDSVPYVIVEGKRRDVEVQGAQEVEDYVKALESVIKESV